MIPIGTLAAVLMPIGPKFQLKCNMLLKIGRGLLESRGEMNKLFHCYRNVLSVFTEIYLSVITKILKWYLRMLKSDLEEISSEQYFSNIFSPSHPGKWQCRQDIKD